MPMRHSLSNKKGFAFAQYKMSLADLGEDKRMQFNTILNAHSFIKQKSTLQRNSSHP